MFSPTRATCPAPSLVLSWKLTMCTTHGTAQVIRHTLVTSDTFCTETRSTLRRCDVSDYPHAPTHLGATHTNISFYMSSSRFSSGERNRIWRKGKFAVGLSCYWACEQQAVTWWSTPLHHAMSSGVHDRRPDSFIASWCMLLIYSRKNFPPTANNMEATWLSNMDFILQRWVFSSVLLQYQSR